MTTNEMERAIVECVVRDALAAGYRMNVYNGGDGLELSVPSEDEGEVLRTLFATSEERLFLYREGKRAGWVLFVHGNDGHDVIADHADRPEITEVLKGATALADSIATLHGA